MNKTYDLSERTTEFGCAVVKFCMSQKRDELTRPIYLQLARSATSIGANYLEASGGSSEKDFRNKIYIAKKEALETSHWLKIVGDVSYDSRITVLTNECNELIRILQKITHTLNQKLLKN